MPDPGFSRRTRGRTSGRMWAMNRVAEFVLRLALTTAVVALMLVPTGVCICGHAEEGPGEEHQPGCPEVRKLDRAGPAAHYAGDDTAAAVLPAADDAGPAGPPRLVAEVGHGPPRGQPLYLTLQTLRI